MLRQSVVRLAKDPFKVLGLARSATKSEVKAKYRDLAKQYHPDNTQSGDSKMMEEINRAYNLLLKEGAYERLHTRALSNRSPNATRPFQGPHEVKQDQAADGAGGSGDTFADRRRSPLPFDNTGVENEVEDYAKVAALNPETERVTPEGKFMYQNRDTGEWTTLDKPLIRSESTRYGTFVNKQTDELYQEIREMMRKSEELHQQRTTADRMRDRFADGGNLPTNDMRILTLILIFSMYALYLAAKRTLSYGVHQRSKRSWYKEVRDNKVSYDELYDEVKDEIDLSVAAATLVYLAALKKKSLDDPVVDPCPEGYYNAIVAPRSHFAITPGV